MFSKATANFVHQIDPEGSLIHVSRINDSRKLIPMALVVKRKRLWFWQRPKYQPTDFTLGDLLQGDGALGNGVFETSEFLTYEGKFGHTLAGKLDGEAASVNLTLDGRAASKLHTSFGKLRKETLDVKRLLCDSSNRLVDMQHVLVQQLEKQAEVLAVVKETVLTTSPCTVTHTRKEHCAFQGVMGLVGMLGSSVKICLKDNNDLDINSDVSLEIPSSTVIAYSVLELEIKKDGHYEICLQPGKIGGFEADMVNYWSSNDSLTTVDGMCNDKENPDEVPSDVSQNGSCDKDLSPLAELPQSTRHALFQKLQEALRDGGVLSSLQCVLEELCCDETLHAPQQEELSDGQRELLSAILDLLDAGGHAENRQSGPAALLNAALLLVSAMEELPDETLSLLSGSHPDFLKAFNTLMCRMEGSSASLSIRSLPVPLQENQAFQLAEQLLSTANVALRRDADRLWLDKANACGALPLVLCLSTHGLSLLCGE